MAGWASWCHLDLQVAIVPITSPHPSPPPESGSAKMKSDPQRTEWRVGTGQGAQHHSVNGFLLSHVQNVATRAAVHTWSVFTWAVEVCDWRDSANTMLHLQTHT